MILLTQNRVGQCRTIASTIRDIITPLTKLKITQGNSASLPQALKLWMVLPDLSEIVLIDATELHMVELSARNHDPISTHRHLAHWSPTTVKITSPGKAFPSFTSSSFHREPISRLSQRTSHGTDAAIVFLAQVQKALHGKAALGNAELDFFGISSTKSHKRGGVGRK